MNDVIWVTWENQVRNKSMSNALGANLFVFTCKGNRLKRYLLCSLNTISAVLRERPAVVFSQNPSIALIVLLLVMRVPLGYKLVSDAHFAGVIACNGSNLFQKILDICNRCVDLVIVTTPEHAIYIRDIGGKSVVCEDPLPDLQRYCNKDGGNDKCVFFICSFDVDEPYRTVFDAADLLTEEGFSLCVTGNYGKVGINPADYPLVSFLGYLSDADYYNKLFCSSVVVDFTENENCLVCGAYEAMSAEVPLVTSNTTSLKRFFTKGAVFSDHNINSIVTAVRTAYKDRNRLKKEIIVWKIQILVVQGNNIKKIYDLLDF